VAAGSSRGEKSRRVGTAQARLCPPYGIGEKSYSVTGLSETCQSLPLKVEMNNVFIGV